MRILVVEDELKVANAIRKGLERHAYAVDLSGEGTDALSMATEYDYDAIVLDLMLPGKDGLAICEELRARERWAPILMLTARGAIRDRTRGLDAGADDYLVKLQLRRGLQRGERLRGVPAQEVGEPFGRPLIRAVRGVGYVLEPVFGFIQTPASVERRASLGASR